jgi:hypothetical protein
VPGTPFLEDSRHERFAQLRASGKTGSDSYRSLVEMYHAKPSEASMTIRGVTLL